MVDPESPWTASVPDKYLSSGYGVTKEKGGRVLLPEGSRGGPFPLDRVVVEKGLCRVVGRTRDPSSGFLVRENLE